MCVKCIPLPGKGEAKVESGVTFSGPVSRGSLFSASERDSVSPHQRYLYWWSDSRDQNLILV